MGSPRTTKLSATPKSGWVGEEIDHSGSSRFGFFDSAVFWNDHL